MKNSHKLLSKFIALFLLTSAINLQAFAFYQDVPSTHPNYQAINVLYTLDKLPKEDSFQPDKLISKEEFYKLIIHYKGLKGNKNIALPYSDIEEGNPYAPYIQKALDLKLLKPGGKSNIFGPKQLVSRYTGLKNLLEHLGIGLEYFFSTEDFPFTDINANTFVAPVAYKAHQIGLIEGSEFESAKRISKGELAEMLLTIEEHKSYSSYTQPQTITFQTVSNQLEKTDNYPILEDVFETLKTDYYYKEELNDEELIYNAIKGMLTSVKDPYTSFQNPKEAEQFLDSLESEYQGIGIVIEIIDDRLTVISPFKDSPAEKAGIKAGDIITEVDGITLNSKTLEQSAALIKGEAGTTVKLKVLRDGQELSFLVQRGFILIETVESKIIRHNGQNIGYISLLSFNADSAQDFEAAIKKLQSENPSGYIIDLRNNPGGYVDVAVNIMSLFSKSVKTAVKIKFGNGYTQEYKTTGDGLIEGEKIAVLINQGSASASEIFAGFVQDHKLGKVIGETSFGKGSVQQINNYYDNSLLKFTSAKWHTPNGKNITESGITPDLVISNNSDNDDQLEAALNEF